jgi:predicted Zn-dependent peptidase
VLIGSLRSVVEEEDERGMAHIIEHLAFRATARYTNHDVVKFLESIGAKLGACQNALTTTDETIYEFSVPLDKPSLLSQAISVLAEFSTEVTLHGSRFLLPGLLLQLQLVDT